MTEALKTEYDTLTTIPRSFERDPDYYLQKWLRRKGLLKKKGGGRLEKFRRISRYQVLTAVDIIEDRLPRVVDSEYYFYKWNVGIVLCVYCGEKLSRDTRTQDHIIPRAQGGGLLGRDNLEPSCETCNRKKGDKSLLMFMFDRSRE